MATDDEASPRGLTEHTCSFRVDPLAAGLPSSGKVQLRRRTVDGVGYLRGTDVAAWMRANGRADLAARLEGML